MATMRRYLTEQEQRQLFSTVKKFRDVLARRDCAWMRLLRDTGFRIGEFSKLDVPDALTALQLNYIHIDKTHRKGKKRDHTKLMTQPVREALQDLLEIRREMGYLDESGPLVMSRKHGRMTVRAYQQRIAFWCQLADLPGNISPHWMRHTRAMNIMRRSTSNDPRGIVQADLGHATIASSGIYTEISKEELQDALREVDGMKPLRKRDVGRHLRKGVAA